MANAKHLRYLRQGSAIWNTWTVKHAQIQPDLSGADLINAILRDAILRDAILRRADLYRVDLSGADLINANLSEANLSEADLSRANLSGANLSEVNLSEANLSGANLSGANLYGTNLSRANLYGTNLSRANLYGTNLSRANLSEANLSEANLNGANLRDANLRDANLRDAYVEGTIFAEIDLRTTYGLSTIWHNGRSWVDLPSIQLPQDGSALHFLRGTGIPDEWIDFYRTTQMHPIQYHSCFISYSSKDEMIAKRLHADLQAEGVRCWFAPHDLKPGDFFREEIDKAMHLQEKMLLLLSQDSVTSQWVKYEVNRTLTREIEQERTILFPIRLDETVLQSTSPWAADLRAHRHIGDFTHWNETHAYHQAFEHLLHHLKQA